MTTLTLRLSKDLLRLLQKRSVERGEEPQKVVLGILQKELDSEAKSAREQVIEALRASGLVRPLSENLRKMSDSSVTHAEVEAAIAKAGGKPLSEIIIEQRGPKPWR